MYSMYLNVFIFYFFKFLASFFPSYKLLLRVKFSKVYYIMDGHISTVGFTEKRKKTLQRIICCNLYTKNITLKFLKAYSYVKVEDYHKLCQHILWTLISPLFERNGFFSCWSCQYLLIPCPLLLRCWHNLWKPPSNIYINSVSDY